MRSWRYQRKRTKAAKQIIPGTHSLEETIQYMKDKYHTYEAEESNPLYSRKMLELRLSIIQREKPELIGADVKLERPEYFEDESELRSWFEKFEQWNEELLKKSAVISQDVFPLTCHLYLIKTTSGEIEIEVADHRGFMGTSMSGDVKKMAVILKDIYCYYGVSKEDIEQKTPRYQELLSVLSN